MNWRKINSQYHIVIERGNDIWNIVFLFARIEKRFSRSLTVQQTTFISLKQLEIITSVNFCLFSMCHTLCERARSGQFAHWERKQIHMINIAEAIQFQYILVFKNSKRTSKLKFLNTNPFVCFFSFFLSFFLFLHNTELKKMYGFLLLHIRNHI